MYRRYLLSAAIVGLATQALGQVGTYVRVDEVMDWGATTTRLILDMGAELSGPVDPAAFAVTATRSDPRLETPLLDEGPVALTGAHVSDAQGNPAARGQHVTLIPAIGPAVPITQALNYGRDPVTGYNFNAWTRTEYVIRQVAAVGSVEGVVATGMSGYTRPLLDAFQFDSARHDDPDHGRIALNYAYFVPEEDGGPNPLIVWLHGGGEGGTDPTIPLAPNKATEFASPRVQALYGGAYVLVPQAPTRWMHGPDETPGGGPKEDALSIYSGALQALVEEFVAARPDIDPARIYLGGLSNGGFMTVRMLIDNPDYYAAGLAVCQALDVAHLGAGELERIRDVPLWLVTAATDRVVPPDRFVAPLYDRLQQMGARDVRLSYLPDVTDMTGLHTGPDGRPHEYNGHFSWIRVYNDELAYVEGGGSLYGPMVRDLGTVGGREVVTVLEWLAAQGR